MAEHVHTTPTPTSPPAGRRNLFAVSAAILLARGTAVALAHQPAPSLVVPPTRSTPAALMSGAHPDAELIGACEQHLANIVAYNSCGLSDEDAEPLYEAYEATRDIISEAEPATVDGMVAKARAAIAEMRSTKPGEHDVFYEGSVGARWGWDLMHDLVRLFGGEHLA